MAITNAHYVIRVSDLATAVSLEGLHLFGYDPAKPLEEQSVQVPVSLFMDLFQSKLTNDDGTIHLEDLPDGTTLIRAIPNESIQVDCAGGTKVLDVTAAIVSVECGEQINYVGFKSAQRTLRVINNSTLQVIISLGIASANGDKVLKDYALDTLILPVGASVMLFKTADGWRIIGLFGVSYFPDIAMSEEAAVLVNPNGVGGSEDIKNFTVVDESITSPMLTSADLEARYPDRVTGFSIMCPSARVAYVKMGDLAGWAVHQLEPV